MYCAMVASMVITTSMPASMMYEGYGHVHHQPLCIPVFYLSCAFHKNAIRTLCHTEPLRLNGDSTYIEGMCARPPRAPTVYPWPEAASISAAAASFEPKCASTAEATSVRQDVWVYGEVEKAQGA